MLNNIILNGQKDADIVDSETMLLYEGLRDFKEIKTLEAIADTSEMTLTYVGDFFPNLEKLRLNNSIIPSMRDISTSLKHLKFLCLAHCKLTNLDGIATISPKLEELYLAFNKITDIYELMTLNRLKVLDIEHNKIPDIESVAFLSSCPKLKALTLIGNPCSKSETYRKDVMQKIPQIIYLDEKRLRPKTPNKSKPTESIVTPVKCSTDQENIQENVASSAIQKKVFIKDFEVINKSPFNIKNSPTKSEHSVPFIGCKSPLSTLKNLDGNDVITDQLEDELNNRPPTARAYVEPSLKSEFQSPILNQKHVNQKKIVTPHFKRPVSAYKIKRSECTE